MIKIQQFVAQTLSAVISRYSYYVDGMSDWAPLDPNNPPVVTQGKNFALRVYWRNTGDVTCRGSCNVEVTKPDGTKLTLNSYYPQPVEMAPGYETYFQFYAFNVNKLGTYTAKVDLYGEEVSVPVGIEVHIVNYPSNSYMWNPIIWVPTKSNPTKIIGPDRYLYMYEYLIYPYTVGGANISAEMDVTIVDSASQLIYSQLARPVTISDGVRYRWNCANNSLEAF